MMATPTAQISRGDEGHPDLSHRVYEEVMFS